MKYLYKILFFQLVCFAPLLAGAQFGIGKKGKSNTEELLNSPTKQEYALMDPEYRNAFNLENGYPEEKETWIVYSDRDKNTAYKSANNNESQPLDVLSFMQPCFVIGQKGNYLELVEYVPGINMGKSKVTLSNPKYIGWVPTSNLLLWNKALKDRNTNSYLKSITAYGTQRIFKVLPEHVSGDSIITFSNPFLNRPVGKTGMENIFYIYKQSDDGNEYLVGPDPMFLPERSAGSNLCWISKDLLRIWGTKGFVSLNKDLPAEITFYHQKPSSLVNTGKDGLINVAKSPDTETKTDLEKLYPILQYNSNGDGSAAVFTGYLDEVLDRSGAKIFNESGDVISNEVIEKFRKNYPKLNIVMVIAGGAKNGQYFNNLRRMLTTSDWRDVAMQNFSEVNIGAVIYKNNGAECDNDIAALTGDLKEIDDFIAEHLKAKKDGCDNGSYYQALNKGIEAATKMLYDHKDESNIIMVYGFGGDNYGNIGNAISGILQTKARLLFFQTHNVSGEKAYSDFVGNAKQLLKSTGDNITTSKRQTIAQGTYPNVSGAISFASDATGRIQFMQYPTAAITQGYLIYPNANENMPVDSLSKYLDTLILSIATDNRTIDLGYQNSIAMAGANVTKIKPVYEHRFSDGSRSLPQSFLRANTLRNQNFLIPAWMMVKGTTKNNQTGLSSGVLLSADEYNHFVKQLALIGAIGATGSKESIVNSLKRVVEQSGSGTKGSARKNITDMTFSEVMGAVTGYFPVDALWMRTTLDQYQKEKNIPIELGLSFINTSKGSASWLRDQNNNSELQTYNNGRIYYVLNESSLPLNSILENSITTNIAQAPADNKNNTLAQEQKKDAPKDIAVNTNKQQPEANSVIDNNKPKISNEKKLGGKIDMKTLNEDLQAAGKKQPVEGAATPPQLPAKNPAPASGVSKTPSGTSTNPIPTAANKDAGTATNNKPVTTQPDTRQNAQQKQPDATPARGKDTATVARNANVTEKSKPNNTTPPATNTQIAKQSSGTQNAPIAGSTANQANSPVTTNKEQPKKADVTPADYKTILQDVEQAGGTKKTPATQVAKPNQADTKVPAANTMANKEVAVKKVTPAPTQPKPANISLNDVLSDLNAAKKNDNKEAEKPKEEASGKKKKKVKTSGN